MIPYNIQKGENTLNREQNQKKKKENRALIPIILMIGFIPLIVHAYTYQSNLSQFDWFPSGAASQTDMFFAWKMVAIIIVGISMMGILIWQYTKTEKLQFENSFFLLMIYAIFVGMSALFSNHKYWVARGTYELFEPVWVVFAYIILCYYVYNFVQEEQQVDFLMRWSSIGILIVTLIGVFQYLGLDFFKSALGKHLITNPGMWSQLDQISFNFEEKTSYTTLYNPNFLSFYFGMLIPLVICLFIGSRKIWQRIALIIAEILCIVCLIGSKSMTGWIALAIGGVILVLVLLSRNKKLFATGIVVVAVGMIAAIILGNTTGIGKNIKNTIIGTYHIKDQFTLGGIETKQDDVVLNIHENELHISYSNEADGTLQIICRDADGNDINMLPVEGEVSSYILDDQRFSGIQAKMTILGESTPGICVTIDGIEWNFINDGESYLYVNSAGNAVKYKTTKRSTLFYTDAMSLRGHIWNDTIPVLGKHVVMGSGANTFMFEYPQDDYISKVYIYGQNNYDVKAHCWYLQQWVETGLIGTLALIGFFLWYIIQSVRIYRRVDLHERLSWTGFGVFSAVLVYLLAGIVNDSNVCTAPVFWGMLGLGFALNRMLVKKNNLFVKEPISALDRVTADVEARKEEKKIQNAGETISTVSSPKKKPAKKQSRKQRKNNK